MKMKCNWCENTLIEFEIDSKEAEEIGLDCGYTGYAFMRLTISLPIGSPVSMYFTRYYDSGHALWIMRGYQTPWPGDFYTIANTIAKVLLHAKDAGLIYNDFDWFFTSFPFSLFNSNMVIVDIPTSALDALGGGFLSLHQHIIDSEYDRVRFKVDIVHYYWDLRWQDDLTIGLHKTWQFTVSDVISLLTFMTTDAFDITAYAGEDVAYLKRLITRWIDSLIQKYR